MRNILVTAIGGDVGHSILKCLKNRENRIFGCDMIDYPVGMDLVEENFKVPSAESNKYVEIILEICERCKITHIIPVSEPEIEKISHFRKDFEDKGIKLLINNNNILECCLDKYDTCKFLDDNKIQNFKYYTYDQFVEDGEKYIIKLRSSCGSKLLRVFTKKTEIDDCLEQYNKEDLIIQEYIDATDEEYTVGIFGHKNEYRLIIFRRKLQGGFTKFVELVEDKNISEQCIKVANAFQLEGSVNIQLRMKGKQVFIFEINPRLSGTTNFRNILGFKDVLWWLDMVDNIELPKYQPKYKTAIGIREMNEKFLVLEEN